MNELKSPTFWISVLGILGAVGSGLADTGNPTLIAIGAVLTGIYAISSHLKDALIGKATVEAQIGAAAQTIPSIEQIVTTVIHQLQGWEITPKQPAPTAPPHPMQNVQVQSYPSPRTPDMPAGPGGSIGTIPPFTQGYPTKQ